MIQDNDQNIIIIGSAETIDEKNIYSASWRKQVIQDVFPEINISLIKDTPDDKEWVLSLKKLLKKLNVKIYKFYCGDKEHDYAIQVIKNNIELFKNIHIEIIEISRKKLPISATQIRESLKKWWINKIEKLVPKEVYRHIKNREV